MEATLKKWGNSQGVLVPKHLCEDLGITIGDRLEIKEEDGAITMRPAKNLFARSHKLTANELFADWKGEYKAPSDWDSRGAEIEWGMPTNDELAW